MPEKRGLFGKFDIKHPLAQEMEQVASANRQKRLDPEEMVEWARRHPQSKLHGEFNWNDSRAAQLYRIEQARRLIQVYIEVVVPDRPPVRAWVSLPEDRGTSGGYRRMRDVMANAVQREHLLADAYREMELFKSRYANLDALANVFRAIDAALRRRQRRGGKGGRGGAGRKPGGRKKR